MPNLRNAFTSYLIRLCDFRGIEHTPEAQYTYLRKLWLECALGGPSDVNLVPFCFRLLCVIEGALYGPKCGFKDTSA